MFVTIVCVCGQHNSVHDLDLDHAICSRCNAPLLQPGPTKSATAASSVRLVPVRVAIAG